MAEIKILYLCDRKECENCSDDCFYTSDPEHAKNFEVDYTDNDTILLIEKRHGDEER